MPHPRPRPLVRGLIVSVVALLSAGGASALGVLPSSPRPSASEVEAAGDPSTTVPATAGAEVEVAVDAEVEVEVAAPAHPSTTAPRPTTTTTFRPTTTTSVLPLPVLPLPAPDAALTPGIYVMRPDGSGGVRVSDHPGLFSWSPDGRSIALVRDGNLVVASADGSGERALPSAGTGAYGPVWSSDGSRIAFGRDEDLWVVAADGSGSATLVDRQARLPSWAPDGRLSATRFNGELVVWDRDGTGRVLAVDNWGPVPAAWSSDGSTVAYMTNRIIAVSAEGTGGRALTPVCCATEFIGSPLAWSPDSRSLAYIDGGDAYTVAADGTPLARLDKATAPSWSPDGRRLAFLDHRAIRLDGQTSSDVAVASANGTDRRVVLSVPGPLWASSVSWSRAADRLAVAILPRSVRPPAG